KAVHDNEAIRYLKPYVVDRQRAISTRLLVEKRHGLEGSRVSREEGASKELERVAGIHDVLDDDHVAPRDVASDVLHEARRPGGLRRMLVAGDTDEIDLVGDGEALHEVGHEDDASAKHPDQERNARRMVARDLPSDLADPALDGVAADQDFHGTRPPTSNGTQTSIGFTACQIRRK